MIILLLILPCIFLLLVFGFLGILAGRHHPGLKALQGWRYAHRGLHRPGVPENSMAAFRAALDKGYGIELDLHLMQDGKLAVIHDYSLLRTAGVDVKIEALTAESLCQYRLEGTNEQIPLFSQVLELFQGKAPLIVELKADGDNYGALTDAAVAALAGYKGPWCMESFDPRCIRHLKKHHPQVIRGQLSEDFVHNKANPMPYWTKFLLTHQLFNLLTKPDFLAYNFLHRKNFCLTVCRKFWGIQGVSWTLKTQEQFDDAVKEGYIPIFEGFEP